MERGALDLVLPEWFPEPPPLHVVYLRSRQASRRVRVFVDWLAALIGERDGIQLRSTLPCDAAAAQRFARTERSGWLFRRAHEAHGSRR